MNSDLLYFTPYVAIAALVMLVPFLPARVPPWVAAVLLFAGQLVTVSWVAPLTFVVLHYLHAPAPAAILGGFVVMLIVRPLMMRVMERSADDVIEVKKPAGARKKTR